MDEYSSDYSVIRPFLRDGEMVLWTGKPYQSVRPRPQVGIVIFSIFWLSFAVFWTVMATAGAGFVGLFGLPFVGVGVWLIWNVVFGTKKRLKNTVYAVTDTRALILTQTRRGTNCTEYVFSNLHTLQLDDMNGTRGTIRFASDITYDSYGNRTQSINTAETTAFLMIDNVQEVYRLISEHIAE